VKRQHNGNEIDGKKTRNEYFPMWLVKSDLVELIKIERVLILGELVDGLCKRIAIVRSYQQNGSRAGVGIAGGPGPADPPDSYSERPIGRQCLIDSSCTSADPS